MISRFVIKMYSDKSCYRGVHWSRNIMFTRQGGWMDLYSCSNQGESCHFAFVVVAFYLQWAYPERALSLEKVCHSQCQFYLIQMWCLILSSHSLSHIWRGQKFLIFMVRCVRTLLPGSRTRGVRTLLIDPRTSGVRMFLTGSRTRGDKNVSYWLHNKGEGGGLECFLLVPEWGGVKIFLTGYRTRGLLTARMRGVRKLLTVIIMHMHVMCQAQHYFYRWRLICGSRFGDTPLRVIGWRSTRHLTN